MSTSADRTYEEQNDASLNKLYDKVKNLVSKAPAPGPSRSLTPLSPPGIPIQRGVTTDIYSDAESQREGLLADASQSFDNFAARLQNTSQKFTRSIVNARGNRLMLYIVGGVVLLFLLYKLVW